MKKVVLLAPYFVPRRRVGSWRPFKFAIHLRELGWEPHIITIQESSGVLTEKEERLLSGIPIYKIKPPFDFTRQSGSSMEEKETKGKSRSPQTFFDPFLNWVDKNVPIDTWLPLFWLRKNIILETIEQINPDVLWSTGDPWSSHWLARQIAQKKNVPWVADFRDPWTLGDINLKERSSFSRAVDERAERKIVEKATILTFTSRATEKLYQNHYADLEPQTATFYNCFDMELYNQPVEESLLFNTNKLNLLFFGKFRRLSPARPLVDILARLNEGSENKELPISVHSFGELSPEDAAYAREKGVLSYFKIQDPVPPEKALSVLSQADLLWLSTDPERVNIIPAKLWDYLAARQPVLSIAPNPEIADILNQTGAGVQIDHHKRGKVADLLNECILAKQQGKPLPLPASMNKETIKEYEASHVTRRLASLFDQLA